jgi:hypothetical protein
VCNPLRFVIHPTPLGITFPNAAAFNHQTLLATTGRCGIAYRTESQISRFQFPRVHVVGFVSITWFL